MGELINGRTPEEIKIGLVCEVPCSKCAYKDHNFMRDNSCSYYVERDVLALIERLEAERDAALAKLPKWISVEERLPARCTPVLGGIKKDGAETYIEHVVIFDGSWWAKDTGVYYDDVGGIVTRWMPLPEPPEVDA